MCFPHLLCIIKELLNVCDEFGVAPCLSMLFYVFHFIPSKQKCLESWKCCPLLNWTQTKASDFFSVLKFHRLGKKLDLAQYVYRSSNVPNGLPRIGFLSFTQSFQTFDKNCPVKYPPCKGLLRWTHFVDYLMCLTHILLTW